MTSIDKPRALTPATQARIVEALRDGVFLLTACQSAGITARSWYYWRRLVEAGAERAQVYAEFFAACDRASAIAEQAALHNVHNGFPGWQGSAWFLERRFPARWGKRSTLTLRGVPKDLATLTDEQLDDLERRVRKRH